MGKSCIRFATLDALPLDVIGDALSRVSVDDYVAVYERSPAGTASGRKAAVKKTKKAKPSRGPAKKSR